MNEGLVERFGRSRNGGARGTQQALLWIKPADLNLKVRAYFETATRPVNGGSWLGRPEVPSSAEILDKNADCDSSSSSFVEIVPNKEQGAWESKEAYLGAIYELLREDSLRPLRTAVAQVHICALTCSTRRIATKITFSLRRTGKKILWQQSKRLIAGSLVVLTPKADMFKTKAIVATVAARPLSGLQQEPPEIDVFIERAEEQEIDPAIEWVMVEDRRGLYEAERHTLLALQRMMIETFPLSEHLIEVKRMVAPPTYVATSSKMDLTSVLVNDTCNYESVDVLSRWPSSPTSNLDTSQLEALFRILTKRLAIIQGPPGTGKTFISVQAIKIMLANRRDGDPPIIIACQTNHAVDQILRHIARFEPEFARLGTRSKDRGIIRERSLYQLRQRTAENKLPGCLVPVATKRMKDLEREIALLLAPLSPEHGPLSAKTLFDLGLLTEDQASSLTTGASRWIQDQSSSPHDASSPFTVWLGEALIPVPPKQMPEDFGFDFEEVDLEFEQLREMEAENAISEDEIHEGLAGASFELADNFTSRNTNSAGRKLDEVLREQDMWKIPRGIRPHVYRYLQSEAKAVITDALRSKAKEYNKHATLRRIGFFEKDETILKQQKIIGMTTTGFSKYRGLLASLEPRVVLIEEAAEILEPPVAVTCVPSLQHLILVGDHKQLRPHTHVREHEGKPYFLNVSLFERMVNNGVEFSQLAQQRRMIPEIRRILFPIYGSLIQDHPSVLDSTSRPNVPGMGGINSWFFTHEWPEARDDQMSSFNAEESRMIAGFVEYLMYNGIESKDITVLTFYNGQRKRLLSDLRHKLGAHKFNVVTVDSYQGEENQIVILSLVRSNDCHSIGFLGVDNRVCVALSRAQCGFYMFGNGQLLFDNRTWQKVLQIIGNMGKNQRDRLRNEPRNRLSKKIMLTCTNHNNKTCIESPDGWEDIVGGCAQVMCDGHLPCGHFCKLKCHPFPHTDVACTASCGQILPCGHDCDKICGEVCACKACGKKQRSPNKVSEPDQVDEEVSDDAATPRVSDNVTWSQLIQPSDQEPEALKSASNGWPRRNSLTFSSRGEVSVSQQRPPSTAEPATHASPDHVLIDTLCSDLVQWTLGSEKTPSTNTERGIEAKGPEYRIINSINASQGLSSQTQNEEVRKDWSREASLLD